MELRVNEPQLPAEIVFNYDEIKLELAQTLQKYETAVYTADQMKIAKADKASLNKLRKALNDERIRREREYMKPFADFKQKINELISLIDKPVGLIDSQIKEYEEQKKQEKRKQIEEYFESECDFPEWLKLDRIFDNRWLNATTSMKSIEDDLKDLQERICSDLDVLSELPAFGFEATEAYKQTLNIQAAVNEGKRLADIQKRKEEAERMRKETEAARIAAENERRIAAEVAAESAGAVNPVTEIPAEPAAAGPVEPKMWISFRAELTVPQAKELRAFFEQRGIKFEAI